MNRKRKKVQEVLHSHHWNRMSRSALYSKVPTIQKRALLYMANVLYRESS